MKPIPLTRCVFLMPFNQVLMDIGAPSTSLLAKFHLPTSLEEKANSYVPLLPAIRFTIAAQTSQGIADIGFHAAERLHFGHLSERLRASVGHSPTLFAALQQVCALATIEDTILHVRLEPGEHRLRVCCTLAGTAGMLHLESAQWILLSMFIYIVRQFTGPSWAPETIAFEARYTPNTETQSRWPNTRFLSGQTSSWIDIPVSQLSRPNLAKNGAPGQPGSEAQPLATDAVTTLKLMLSSYLDEHIPSMAEVAEIAGTSLRSFQRELAFVGLTYFSLLDQVRFEKAITLLHAADAKIIDVAFATGYADPAHFARAFRRIAGVTPREFRENPQAH